MDFNNFRIMTVPIMLLLIESFHVIDVFDDLCKDGSSVSPMVSLDTAGMKELDLLSKDIEELKRYTSSVVSFAGFLLLLQNFGLLSSNIINVTDMYISYRACCTDL